MNIGAAATTASDSAANAARRLAPAVAITGSTDTEAAAAGCNTLPPLTMIIILAATLVGSAVSRTATGVPCQEASMEPQVPGTGHRIHDHDCRSPARRAPRAWMAGKDPSARHPAAA